MILTFILLNGIRYLSARDWPGSGGVQVLAQHAGEMDISVATCIGRIITTSATLKGVDGLALERIVVIDRFRVISSTKRSAGETLDYETLATSSRTIPAAFLIGKSYFLVTQPQKGGKLFETKWNWNLDNNNEYSVKPFLEMPVTSSDQEAGQIAFLTKAGAVQKGRAPYETLVTSACECLRFPDKANMDAVLAFLTPLKWPVDPIPGPYMVLKPLRTENAVTGAIRSMAAASPNNVRVSMLEVLNRWGLPGTDKQIIDGLVECAHEPNAYVPAPGFENTSLHEYLPTREQTVKALVGAKNLDIARFFLMAAAPNTTLSDDKKIAVWLDAPEVRMRYFAACHFAKSRSRPDLKPSEDLTYGKHDYLDIDQKVQAWKDFFSKN